MMTKFIKKHGLLLVVPVFCLCLAFTLVACSSPSTTTATTDPTPNATTAAPATQAAPAVAATALEPWSMDTDCATCHTAEAKTLTDETYLAFMMADMGCVTCHIQEDELKVVHASMSTDTSRLRRLRRTAVSPDTCIECHGTWTDLAALTVDSTVLQDVEGTVVNPHVLTTELNATKQHNGIRCATCHQVHTGTELKTSANSTCLTCHHENVYTCGTCHA